MLGRLPARLAKPKAVLWNKQKGNLNYVYDAPDGAGKIVVRVDASFKAKLEGGKRGTVRANEVVTAGRLDDLSHFKSRAAYDLIEGEL